MRYPPKRYSAAIAGSRYAADGLPAGVKTPMIVIAASPRFSTMCTCRGRSRKAEPAPSSSVASSRCRRPGPCGHEDDLVVQVVVPRRLARRDVAGEERRACRAVVRPEEELERARARRLLLLRDVQGDDELTLPHRRMQIGARPGRHHDELERVGRLGASRSHPRAREPALPARSGEELSPTESTPEPVDTNSRESSSASAIVSVSPACERQRAQRERGIGERLRSSARP